MSFPQILRSFHFRVAVVVVVALFFTLAFSHLLIYRATLQSQFNELRDKLKTVAIVAAETVDAASLQTIPLDRSGMEAPAYQAITARFKEIKRKVPSIKYIYIMTRTGQEGVWQFVVDADPFVKRAEGITAYPGDKYDVSRFPDMERAYDAPAAAPALEKDEWGVSLSGYAPIKDAAGQTVALLGIDMAADDVYLSQREFHHRTLIVFIFGFLFSLALGIVISRRVSGPVATLVKATREIGKGNLDYRVDVTAIDEIEALEKSFNLMIEDLGKTRRRNQEYFYKVIQSLVRIVEARDRYTMGHSERVAEYAVMTAAAMGIKDGQLELLREAAILHDIGKLAVTDNILNKPGALDAKEWEQIRSHPAVGEEILKPVALKPEILSIVRSHHERIDGKGYPDGVKAGKLGLLVQIISVADAFDAMTSSRAYRPAMPRPEAIAELERHKGTQFSPDVVDAFVRSLNQS